MSKYTPGPWKIQDNTVVSAYSQLRVDSESDGAVAVITNGGQPSDTDYANARLIAAAPEMARALKGIRDQVIGTHGDNRDVAIPSEVYDLVMQLLDRIERKEE